MLRNFWSCNLNKPKKFNLIHRPFLAGRRAQSGHETRVLFEESTGKPVNFRVSSSWSTMYISPSVFVVCRSIWRMLEWSMLTLARWWSNSLWHWWRITFCREWGHQTRSYSPSPTAAKMWAESPPLKCTGDLTYLPLLKVWIRNVPPP